MRPALRPHCVFLKLLTLSCALAFGSIPGTVRAQSISTTGIVDPALVLPPGEANLSLPGSFIRLAAPGGSSATLLVNGGAGLTTLGLSIADGPSTVATATFDGLGTRGSFVAPSQSPLIIGNWGAGSLTVSGGAVVSAGGTGTFAAIAAGSTGSLTISGPGSRLETSTTLGLASAQVFTLAGSGFDFGVPGASSSATVSISNGGMLANSGNALLSSGPGGNNPLGTETTTANVTVTGVGSQWLNTQVISIGSAGTATVSITDGAQLRTTATDGALFLGSTAGRGNGTLTIGGNGALVDIAAQMVVGFSGTATVNVNSGGTLTTRGLNNNPLLIARDVGGSGTLNIDGGVVNVLRSNNAPFVGVGFRSTGVLNVTNGGYLAIGDTNSGVGLNTGAQLGIGGDPGSGPASVVSGQGTMMVAGAGSKVDLLGINQVTTVGRAGSASTGLLTIVNGGVVNGGRLVHIGRGLTDAGGATIPGFGATGTVVVDGAGSKLNVVGIQPSTGNGAVINVGREDGVGTLTIRNGGSVLIDGTGSTGTSPGLTIARDPLSSGTLNIQSGGALTIVGDSSLSVGRLGAGAINVTGGGILTLNNTTTLGGALVFGGDGSTTTGGTFSGLISGTGSTVTLTGIDMSMNVGSKNGGSGLVTVNSGAAVSPGGGIIVASESGSNGTLNIAGAGTTISIASNATDQFGARLIVGRSGIGAATVSNGAIVNLNAMAGTQSAGLRVGGTGTAAGGVGTLTVTGAGSTISIAAQNETFTVGRDTASNTAPSVGTVNITNGGQILHSATAKGSIGHNAGSVGTVNVIGEGSRLVMGTFLGIGRDVNDNAGGIGVLNVTNGGYVQATTIHNGITGTITGSGTIDGTIINDGVINPGNSPGTLRITNGTLIQGPTGKLILEVDDVGGTIVHDKLVFDPAVVPQLDNVQFVFLGSTNPVAAASQGVLDIDNFLLASIGGSEVPLSQALAGNASLLEAFLQEVQAAHYSGSASDGSQIVAFGNYDPFAGTTGQVTVTPAVPEPHEYILLLAGLGVLSWRVRRRRRQGL